MESNWRSGIGVRLQLIEAAASGRDFRVGLCDPRLHLDEPIGSLSRAVKLFPLHNLQPGANMALITIIVPLAAGHLRQGKSCRSLLTRHPRPPTASQTGCEKGVLMKFSSSQGGKSVALTKNREWSCGTMARRRHLVVGLADRGRPGPGPGPGLGLRPVLADVQFVIVHARTLDKFGTEFVYTTTRQHVAKAQRMDRTMMCTCRGPVI
ncbi:Hypothetical predicted protein [Olea europaea subsp. europaea]|uniref:Uncharacterized protein n=1 Tax=Olea europaea subsp. europaea TaxID=158383 RepID=A0A8S0TKP9_OLEEU|nr:Hypothetical predicted protein [Olea europaea subsp. europaea]